MTDKNTNKTAPADAGERPDAQDRVRRWGRWIIPLLLVVLVGLYAASGLCAIGPSEAGLVRQFGKIVSPEPMPPGLHYHLPWPFQTVEKVEIFKSLRLEAGFWPGKPGLGAAPAPAEADGLEGVERPSLEPFCLTGDTNLIHARLVVHYNITNPIAYLDAMLEPERVLAAAIDAALVRVVGRMGVDAILTKGRRQVVADVAALAGERLKRVGAPLEITSLELTGAEAPEPVRGAFREVINAQMEMTTAVHRAQGKREQLLAQAEAEANSLRADADVYAARRLSKARARIEGFQALVEQSAGAEPLARRRLLLESLARVLPGVRKVVLPPGTQPTVRILTAPGRPLKKEPAP